MGYIGDSRAVLGSKDCNDAMVATQLSVDMKPDLPSKTHFTHCPPSPVESASLRRIPPEPNPPV